MQRNAQWHWMSMMATAGVSAASHLVCLSRYLPAAPLPVDSMAARSTCGVDLSPSKLLGASNVRRDGNLPIITWQQDTRNYAA